MIRSPRRDADLSVTLPLAGRGQGWGCPEARSIPSLRVLPGLPLSRCRLPPASASSSSSRTRGAGGQLLHALGHHLVALLEVGLHQHAVGVALDDLRPGPSRPCRRRISTGTRRPHDHWMASGSTEGNCSPGKLIDTENDMPGFSRFCSLGIRASTLQGAARRVDPVVDGADLAVDRLRRAAPRPRRSRGMPAGDRRGVALGHPEADEDVRGVLDGGDHRLRRHGVAGGDLEQPDGAAERRRDGALPEGELGVLQLEPCRVEGELGRCSPAPSWRCWPWPAPACGSSAACGVVEGELGALGGDLLGVGVEVADDVAGR